MPLTSFEKAMQTVACAVSEHMENKNSVPMMTMDVLKKKVKEYARNLQPKDIILGHYTIKTRLGDDIDVQVFYELFVIFIANTLNA